nr:reverse transcriptase domain-containing protein [Tanacetum cinerariifolium]
PTCMTLELADHSVSKPIGIAKDVKVKVGMFHFLADFVVVDFEPDPRVPLILGRCFLKTGRALIDVHKGELTLHIGNEAITYNLDQTSRYSANYDQMTVNKIDVTDEAGESTLKKFSVSLMLPRTNRALIDVHKGELTLRIGNEAITYNLDQTVRYSTNYNQMTANKIDVIESACEEYSQEGDILLLEAILNSEPLPPPPNQEQNMPSFKEELKAYEA